MKKTRRRALLVAALLIFIGVPVIYVGNHPISTGPAEGNRFVGTPTTQPRGNSFRIATFNIDGGQGTDGKVDLDRTARCFQKINFIGLEEVHGFLFGEPSNQAEILAGKLKLPFLWAPVERTWGHESFGNAVLTDMAVTHWDRTVLPSKPHYALRNYVLTDVDFHGTVIHFLTTHADWKAGGDEQRKIVIEKFLSLPTPAVMMGDLNAIAKDPQIAALLKTPGVEEAVNRVLEPKPSRIDWIFLRGLTTLDAGEVDMGASDHPAYWAEVAPQPQNNSSSIAIIEPS